MKTVLSIAALTSALMAGTSVQAQSPWRLSEAVNAPDWLSISGTTRWRYESLNGQFRAGKEGGDQALSGRTLILFEADAGQVDFGLELIDSRVYLDDADSPLSTSMVNTADILQAYARFDLASSFNLSKADLTLGRYTLDVGSRRFQGRNGFRNTINAFTGANVILDDEGAWQLTAFAGVPVSRKPNDFQGLQDNTQAFDEENWDQLVYGLNYRRAQVWGDAALEVFVFGLKEDEKAERNLITPGFRVHQAPQKGQWDFDFEQAIQLGERGDQDVEAAVFHGEIGYTWDHAWTPRLSVEYEYASGDDPDTAEFERYDLLYGLRRRDFGQTGIHGPLRRVNVSAPGVRLTVKKGPLDGRVLWKVASLAEARDSWAGTGLIDASGQSGDFVGHHLDTRWRYWAIPDQLRLEVGGAWFIEGDYAKDAPNANQAGDTIFGYGMVTVHF